MDSRMTVSEVIPKGKVWIGPKLISARRKGFSQELYFIQLYHVIFME